MKGKENIFIGLCLIIYIATKSFDYLEIEQSSFIKDHLADLVCMPLVFVLIRWIITKIKGFERWRKLPLIAVVMVTVYWSVYFEYYLPSKSSLYIGDDIDIAMYFIGSFVFLLFQNMANTNKLPFSIIASK